MAALTKWNIYKVEGQYIGQSSAFSPQTALCNVMLVLGKTVVEAEVAIKEQRKYTVRLTHESEEFILTPQD